ncbi:MAG: hypothetical protein CL517_07670 [Actinobacteria bacterium]|nr:hypothetical protein [Actinomycetota bacterium]|tara:strand:- start:23916 stop:24095 length:180 start_codon:yes stop_codon:yes gene_type:complete
MTNRIGVVGGDGIGPEVISEGLKVIHASGVNLEVVEACNQLNPKIEGTKEIGDSIASHL